MIDKRTVQYRTSRVVLRDAYRVALVMAFIACWCPIIKDYLKPDELLDPRAQAQEVRPFPTMTPVPVKVYEPDDMSVYISEAVQEFLPTHKSESLMIMHCLAHRENGHAANRNCGDSGASCGPFQYKQETWNRMRKQMIKAGFATEILDRYDKKESARTTAWAINNGNAREWGPIYRDSLGSDFAVCQKPSWYK